MAEHDPDNILGRALSGLAASPQMIAAELRLMALGEAPYTRFRLLPPLIKNIWHAAADMLEERSSAP